MGERLGGSVSMARQDLYRETKRPAYNERFGATAAGSADLKGSAEKPPLRQAAIPLYASRADSACGHDGIWLKVILK